MLCLLGTDTLPLPKLQLHRVLCTGRVPLGAGHQPREWWDRGLEPRWGHACPSVASVVCCVGGSFCNKLILRSEWFSGCVSNYVWSRNVKHEASWARFGVLRHKNKYRRFKLNIKVSQRHLIPLTDNYQNISAITFKCALLNEAVISRDYIVTVKN